MKPPVLTPLLFAMILPGLSGCGDSKPAAGGNVSMRDMEVVDGTANDSMADLDNATADGTLLSNAGALPVQGTESGSAGNSADAGSRKTDSANAGKAGGESGGNTSTAE